MPRTLSVGILALVGMVAVTAVARAAHPSATHELPPVTIKVAVSSGTCTITVDKPKVWVESKSLSGESDCDGTNVFCEIEWILDAPSDDWTVTVYPARWEKQDAANESRGKKIRKQLNNGNQIGPFNRTQTRTAQPKKQQLFYFRPFTDQLEYEWTYGVEATDGTTTCVIDPGGCVRKKGSSGCGT